MYKGKEKSGPSDENHEMLLIGDMCVTFHVFIPFENHEMILSKRKKKES
jgi:hypothetical protein